MALDAARGPVETPPVEHRTADARDTGTDRADGSAAAATPRARVSGPDVGTPPATARLAMGGGVSNAGISRMLARQGPDPGGGGGGGGSGAGAPAGGEIDWPAFWADDTLNSIRQVGEVTRVIPFVGLATGGASDLINAGQDLFGATWQYEAPIAHTLIGLRSGVNLLNNGYGHVIYVAQMIQDGLLASVVAAEAVPVSAGIISTAEGIKVPIDLGQEMLDFLIEVTALTNAAIAAPPSEEAEAWLQLGESYLANVMTDFMTLILDSFDGLTGGAAQGSILLQIGNWLKAVGPAVKTFIMAAAGALVGQWNVRGGGLITGGRQAAVGTVDRSVARAPAAGMLAREGGDDALTRAGWTLALIELQRMRLGYDIGDAIVTAAADSVGEHAAAAEELATVLLDGQEPFAAAKEAGLQVFSGMRTRIAMLGELELFGTTGAEKTQGVIDGVADARISLDEVQIPDIELPDVDLGEGVFADTAEAVVGVGSDLAESGIGLVIDQARVALDLAKEAAGSALDEVLANADEIGLFLQTMSEVAARQIVTMGEWLAEFEGRFAEAGNFEEMFEVFINEALAVAGIDANFDFDDVRVAWTDLGGWIDEMTEYASARASGVMPSSEPDVEAMQEVGSRMDAGGPEEPPGQGG